jgi:hypothetical protein
MAEPVEDPEEARLTAGVARRRWGFRVVLSGRSQRRSWSDGIFFLYGPKARCAADISQPGDITHCGF